MSSMYLKCANESTFYSMFFLRIPKYFNFNVDIKRIPIIIFNTTLSFTQKWWSEVCMFLSFYLFWSFLKILEKRTMAVTSGILYRCVTVTMGNFWTEWCYSGHFAIFSDFCCLWCFSKIIFKKTYKPAYNDFKNNIKLFINKIMSVFP